MQRLSSVRSLLPGAEMQESCREPGARGSAQLGECAPAALGIIVTSGDLVYLQQLHQRFHCQPASHTVPWMCLLWTLRNVDSEDLQGFCISNHEENEALLRTGWEQVLLLVRVQNPHIPV